MSITILIPNWNGEARLKSVLDALSVQTYPIDRVVVIDNGSTDGSARLARASGCEVIELGRNTGFSHAVNSGIRAAQTDWVGILNNDVVPERDWLAKLMQAAAARSDTWFAAGKLLSTSHQETIDGAFDAICRGACAWRCGHGRRDAPVWNQPKTIHFAPFTAAIFRASLFERIGLLDEQFESYLEDVDFGLRAATRGLQGLYVPDAVAYHEGSATLGGWHPDTVRRISRNQVLLVAKHYPREWVLRYGWQVLVAQGLWGFTALRHGRFIAYLTGKMEGLRQFRQLRGSPRADVDAVLRASETDIWELQRLTGFDLYWRLYFALT
jgi:GT2 family glycosyltransferase